MMKRATLKHQAINIRYKKIKQHSKPILFFVIISHFLLVGGCWNMVELEDLGIVVAMGIDKLPNDEGYETSLQFINPPVVAGERPNPLSITVLQGTGKTIIESVRKVSEKAPKQIFLSHIQILVISEGVASDGLEEIIDFIKREQDFRFITRFLVARGNSAKSIVSTIQPLEKISASAIDQKLEFSHQFWSNSIEVDAKDVTIAFMGEEKEPIISGVSIEGELEKGKEQANFEKTTPPSTIVMNGIALFNDGKLQKWVDNEEALALLQVINELNNTIKLIDCEKEGQNGHISFELIRSKASITTKVEAQQPTFFITVYQEGIIGEEACGIDLSKKEEIMKLEEELSNNTKQEISSITEVAKSEGMDIFGFGEVLNLKHPTFWKEHKENWNEVFKESTVHVNVTSNISQTGMSF